MVKGASIWERGEGEARKGKHNCSAEGTQQLALWALFIRG